MKLNKININYIIITELFNINISFIKRFLIIFSLFIGYFLFGENYFIIMHMTLCEALPYHKVPFSTIPAATATDSELEQGINSSKNSLEKMKEKKELLKKLQSDGSSDLELRKRLKKAQVHGKLNEKTDKQLVKELTGRRHQMMREFRDVRKMQLKQYDSLANKKGAKKIEEITTTPGYDMHFSQIYQLYYGRFLLAFFLVAFLLAGEIVTDYEPGEEYQGIIRDENDANLDDDAAEPDFPEEPTAPKFKRIDGPSDLEYNPYTFMQAEYFDGRTGMGLLTNIMEDHKEEYEEVLYERSLILCEYEMVLADGMIQTLAKHGDQYEVDMWFGGEFLQRRLIGLLSESVLTASLSEEKHLQLLKNIRKGRGRIDAPLPEKSPVVEADSLLEKNFPSIANYEIAHNGFFNQYYKNIRGNFNKVWRDKFLHMAQMKYYGPVTDIEMTERLKTLSEFNRKLTVDANGFRKNSKRNTGRYIGKEAKGYNLFIKNEGESPSGNVDIEHVDTATRMFMDKRVKYQRPSERAFTDFMSNRNKK